MDNKKIQSILKDALEEEIPSGDIQLWPAVKSLVAGKPTNQQGVVQMNTPLIRRIPRIALAVFAVLALFAIGLATPQGRTFAQEILQFFTRAKSDSFPLQPWQIAPSPDEQDPSDIINATLSIAEVENGLSFDVLEPTWLPEGTAFVGANFKAEPEIAYIFYSYGEGNGFVLKEEAFQSTDDCELCGLVGASAEVEAVQIGNVSGEYVEGVWSLTENGPVWEPNPYLKTMRWQTDGIAFELLFMGPPDSVTQADMIVVAESLASSSALSAQPTAEAPAPLITVAEAEARAGFDAAELSSVPKGFIFLGVRLYGNTISIEYEVPDHGGHLNITQSQEGYYETDWGSVPEEDVVPVKIGERDGEYVQGTFVVYPNATDATWNPDAPIFRLRWVANGIWFEIVKLGDVEAIEYLDQAGLIALAEDLMSQR